MAPRTANAVAAPAQPSAAPDTTSSDYAAMAGYWAMVDTILAGADAMRLATKAYLPQFPNETDADYTYRAQNAKFTNIYADLVNNLAAKPFSEAVSLSDDKVSDALKALAEDIDGRGNNLHVFAANTFFHGINRAIDWILVEFTKAKPAEGGRPLTQAEEAEQGLRPYWVHIPATRMLAVYSDVVGGKEIFVHARIREDRIERDGYGERRVERVRVLNREPTRDAKGQITGYDPATFEVFEKLPGEAWGSVDQGEITLGVIPLVPFVTGRRLGGSWQFVPPMKDAAYVQIEHYQQETALKAAKEMVAYPMLAGQGVEPARDEQGNVRMIPVGPKTVLYAPPNGEGEHGEWAFVTVDAAGLKFLADDIKNTEQQLRELGRQPLTAQTGNLTVVTTAFAAQKGNSAVQAWAINLQDALGQAWRFTAQWLNDTSDPGVKVFTDFDVAMGDDKGPAMITDMRKNGDLSRETTWAEAKRRGVLSADFDPEEEEKRLMAEMPGGDGEDDVKGALPPTPEPGPEPEPEA